MQCLSLTLITIRKQKNYKEYLLKHVNVASRTDLPPSSFTVHQVQDAQATMRLYTMVRKQWEAEIKASRNNKDSSKKSVRKPKFPKNKNPMGLCI